MSQPKVSVIIPTHNRPDLLKRAINSVISQTYSNWEILVIDEGLEKRADGIVSSFPNHKIRYFKRDIESGGAAQARNIGIKNSEGDLIAFLDDDDEWLAQKLEKQISLLKNTEEKNIGFLGCDSEIINLDGTVSLKRFKKFSDLSRELLIHNILPNTSSILVKKDVMLDVGLFRDINVIEDWDLWLRIVQKYNFDNVGEPLVRYYIQESSLTQRWRHKDVAHLMGRFLEMNTELYQKNLDILEERQIYIAEKFISGGDAKNARRHLWSAFLINKSLKNFCLLLFAFLGSAFWLKIRKNTVINGVRNLFKN